MSQRITVIVKNNDLHDGGSAEFDLLVVVVAEQVQLEEELLIRLPLVVVNNGYTNLKLNFILNMFNLISRIHSNPVNRNRFSSNREKKYV